jgi:hypothetical protein
MQSKICYPNIWIALICSLKQLTQKGNEMTKYLVEFKNNLTGKTEFAKLSKNGEQFVQKYQNSKLDELGRWTILNEIKMNYLDSDIDLNNHTIHMVSDMDTSQVI